MLISFNKVFNSFSRSFLRDSAYPTGLAGHILQIERAAAKRSSVHCSQKLLLRCISFEPATTPTKPADVSKFSVVVYQLYCVMDYRSGKQQSSERAHNRAQFNVMKARYMPATGVGFTHLPKI
jgi:hypothetical protein